MCQGGGKMRWIALVLAGAICGEAAGGSFSTIVSSDAPMPGAPGDATLTNIRQIVLADDGDVAISAMFDLTLDAPALLHKPAAGNIAVIAKRGGGLYPALSGTFD